MAETTAKSPRTRGRPTRQQELARALAALGCDPDLISPKRILASIAADADAPAAARVAACRTLLGLTGPSDQANGALRPGLR